MSLKESQWWKPMNSVSHTNVFSIENRLFDLMQFMNKKFHDIDLKLDSFQSHVDNMSTRVDYLEKKNDF